MSFESWLSIEKRIEDRCMQIMQISPYFWEQVSINRLLKLVEVNGFKVNGKYHVIYLSNLSKTDLEKLTRIISYPFKWVKNLKHLEYALTSKAALIKYSVFFLLRFLRK